MSIERRKYPDSDYYVSSNGYVLGPRSCINLKKNEELGSQILCDIIKGSVNEDLMEIIKKYTLRPTTKGNGQPCVKITTSVKKQGDGYVPHLVATVFEELITSRYDGEGVKILTTKDGKRTNSSVENLMRANKHYQQSYIFGIYFMSIEDISTIKSLYNKTKDLEQALKQSGVRDHISVKGKLPDSYRERIQTLI